MLCLERTKRNTLFAVRLAGALFIVGPSPAAAQSFSAATLTVGSAGCGSNILFNNAPGSYGVLTSISWLHPPPRAIR